jgi:hypothetical protein
LLIKITVKRADFIFFCLSKPDWKSIKSNGKIQVNLKRYTRISSGKENEVLWEKMTKRSPKQTLVLLQFFLLCEEQIVTNEGETGSCSRIVTFNTTSTNFIGKRI